MEGFPDDFLFYGVVQGLSKKGVFKITFDCFPANENIVEVSRGNIEPIAKGSKETEFSHCEAADEDVANQCAKTADSGDEREPDGKGGSN